MMHYYKYTDENIRVEFLNSFSGKETIRVNGQVVSEKSSVMGTNHHFTTFENGEEARYTLRTKLGGSTMVMIDLLRNREYLLRDQVVQYGASKDGNSKLMKVGQKLLRSYDLQGALDVFDEALDADPEQPLFYLYRACALSLMERKKEAFESLNAAIDHGLVDREQIITEDALAYLRIQEEFEGFCVKYGLEY